MQSIYAYLVYLVSALAGLSLFTLIYTRVTPFEELSLIKAGNVAALLSLAGALVGFSLTMFSSIASHASFTMFIVWATGAMLVQVGVHFLAARMIPDMNQAIHENNTAMGGLMGSISLAVGIVNAACLT